MREFATRSRTGKRRRVHFRFLVSPVAILGQQGKVTAVRLEKNELRADANGQLNADGRGEYEVIPAGLVLRSVGYLGTPLPGVPYDKRRGTIPNDHGRVIDPTSGHAVMGEYVVGWAKRSATGVIGTNRPDALETVQHMLADLPQLTPAATPDPEAIEMLLHERQRPYVTSAGWRRLDQIETTKGATRGKPRLKFTRVQEMLEALRTPV